MSASLAIVIVSYNTRDLLRNCLLSLRETEGIDTEVWVVDNASVDGSPDMVAAEFPEARLIASDINGGFSYGCNLALRHIVPEHNRWQNQTPGPTSRPPSREHDYIALLNPDTVVPPLAFSRLVAAIEKEARVGAVGPKLMMADGRVDEACRRAFPSSLDIFYRSLRLHRIFPKSKVFARYNYGHIDIDEEIDVDSLVGACMLVKKEAVHDAGLLDETYFMYGEDMDWAWRIIDAGWRIRYVPSVELTHLKRASSSQRPKKSISDFYDAVRIFHRQHYAPNMSPVRSRIIEVGITTAKLVNLGLADISTLRPLALGHSRTAHRSHTFTGSTRRRGMTFFSAPEVDQALINLTCPACSCVGRPELLTVEGKYRLVRCQVCKTQYFRRDAGLDPSGPTGTVSEYWEEYKFSVYENPEVQDEFESRYAEFLNMAAQQSDSLKTVLDLGCGIGNFVKFASSKGLDAYGVDLEPKAIEYALSRGLKVSHSSDTEHLLSHEGQVDLLTMWDVIEHLYEPSETLEEAVKDLRTGGLMLLETPDGNFPARSVLRSLYGITKGKVNLTGPMYYWEHKIYFTETGLRLLLARHGLEVIQVVRRTSPRHKMKQIFEHYAEKNMSYRERLLSVAWPALEGTVRLAQTGNKLILLARKQ